LNRATIIWLLVALAVFGVGTAFSRREEKPPAPSWQRPVAELSEEQRRFYAGVRAFIRDAERARGSTQHWPADAAWALRQHRTSVNYVREDAGLRWLVLVIEPDGRSPPENVPEDDEHHRLSDGTAIHVTVWTQPVSESATEHVTAFPAAEGWVERVSR
jgi:hypothetical protein